MTETRGDVRSRVDFEGAGDTAQGLHVIESRLQEMAKSGRSSATSLDRLSHAFNATRTAVQHFNQVRELASQIGARYQQILQAEVRTLQFVIEHDARLSTASQALTRDVDRLAQAFSGGVAESGHLLNTIRGLDVGVQSMGDVARVAGGALDQLFAPERITEFATTLATVTSGNPLLARLLGAAVGLGVEELQERGAAAAGTTAQSRQAAAQKVVQGLRAGNAATQAFLEREAAFYQERKSSRGGGGRAPAGEPDMVFGTWEEESQAAQQAFDEEQEGVTRALGELRSYEQAAEAELNSAARSASAWWWDDVTRRRTAEQTDHEARLAMIEAEAEAQNSLSEKAMQEDTERNERLMQNLQGFASATDGIAGIFDRIADSEEERGKKSDGWRKASGIAKGILYQIEAIASAAQGALDIGQSNYGGAAAAFVAAAGYEVASIMAFRDLAQGAGGGGGARTSAGTYTPTTPSRINTGSGEVSKEAEKVVVIGLGTTDADVAAAMVKADYSLIRSGKVPLRPGSGVGYAG